MIDKFVLVLSFVIAIICGVRYKKLNKPFKLLSLLLFFSFLLDVANQYVNVRYKNNAPLSHIATIVDYTFYAGIYYYLFKSKYIKKLVFTSILLIAVFFFINALFLQPFYKVFPSNVLLASQILYVIFSMLLFKQMLMYPVQINIVKQSIFWYNTAILFFSTTMFLNLALMNYYRLHNHKIFIVYYFWYTITIIFDLLLVIAILVDRKEIIKNNAKAKFSSTG
jgi:hypothetical protein